ncbi:hypothetical protein [Cohnella sp. GbtcB17]|nr:hypothetical protein [Cohnella sp. GbtcB17]
MKERKDARQASCPVQKTDLAERPSPAADKPRRGGTNTTTIFA